MLKDTSHDLNIHGYSQYNEMYIEISYDKSGWRVRYNFMTAEPFGNIRQDAFKNGMIYQYHYDQELGVIYVAIFEKDKLRIDFSFNNAFYQLDTKTIEEKMVEYIKANEDMINNMLERNRAEMLHLVLRLIND